MNLEIIWMAIICISVFAAGLMTILCISFVTGSALDMDVSGTPNAVSGTPNTVSGTPNAEVSTPNKTSGIQNAAFGIQNKTPCAQNTGFG
jgi:hypothetical protein